jgi:hypothetical protein
LHLFAKHQPHKETRVLWRRNASTPSAADKVSEQASLRFWQIHGIGNLFHFQAKRNWKIS